MRNSKKVAVERERKRIKDGKKVEGGTVCFTQCVLLRSSFAMNYLIGSAKFLGCDTFALLYVIKNKINITKLIK